MASVQPAPNPQQLCSYCHRKPKFNNFEYCGKTCAKEAKQAANSNLCNYCHQKPKFANHEFCGKKCATSAAAVTQTTPKACNTTGGATTGSSTKGNPTPPIKTAPISLPVTLQSGQVIDVADLARTIIQQIPQLQALVSGGNGQPVDVNQIASQLASMLAPGSQTGPTAPGQTNGTSPSSSFVAAISQLPPSPTVISHSVNYTFSSRGQDEDPELESLNSPTVIGTPTFPQESLCIMCGMEPQTYYDYFCGDECKDNALHKYGKSSTFYT
ncbi:uncharacterized protein EV420DRAFT_40970 [Desarmillaria tabescens]|uniref:Uncharacterized protein n=1 Tax=Armillaria tabescens TaxID=1929756 RepID=A0AA39NPQ2_ARMTA|nr:uncharacterized protein EV420DRAFT_40970 [Desarmillaria tabescens]KAK0469540.1 hypothetical protein EV420DRAFT_40970 [Desarmillaria tabescens]